MPQWAEFLELGRDEPDAPLDAIIASQKPNQCCSLIYTSGTTGQPKGVMLSHDNVSSTHPHTLSFLSQCASNQLISLICYSKDVKQSPHLYSLSADLDRLRHRQARGSRHGLPGSGGGGQLPASEPHRGPDGRHLDRHEDGRGDLLRSARRPEGETHTTNTLAHKNQPV